MLHYALILCNVEECLLSERQTARSGSGPNRSASGNLRVALAIAPIRTGGMAMMIHPKAATYDSICALPAVLLDSTLWKYTCNKRYRSDRNTQTVRLSLQFSWDVTSCSLVKYNRHLGGTYELNLRGSRVRQDSK
jgi:hypothetical protein